MPQRLRELADRRRRAGRRVGAIRRRSAPAEARGGGAGRRRRARRCRPAGALVRRHAVADEHRGARLRLVARRLAGARLGARAAPATSMVMMLAAHVHHVAGRVRAGRRRALVGARQLDGRLRGLDVDERLVERDGVADRDLPRHDLGLGQPLADVGQRERSLGSRSSVLEGAVERVEQPVDVRQVVLLDAASAGTACGSRPRAAAARERVEAPLGEPRGDLRADRRRTTGASCAMISRPVFSTRRGDRVGRRAARSSAGR